MSMGIALSTSRLGSVAAGFLLPAIGNENLQLALFVAFIFCGVGVLCALALNYMDKKAGDLFGHSEDRKFYVAISSKSWEKNLIEMKLLSNSWIRLINFKFPPQYLDQQEGRLEYDPNAIDEVSLKDVKNFQLLFWMICLSCILNYICQFVFLQQA